MVTVGVASMEPMACVSSRREWIAERSFRRLLDVLMLEHPMQVMGSRTRAESGANLKVYMEHSSGVVAGSEVQQERYITVSLCFARCCC